MGLFNPPIGQYQLSRRRENDNHNAKININESATIRMLRLNKLGIPITSVKRKDILFFYFKYYIDKVRFNHIILSSNIISAF